MEDFFFKRRKRSLSEITENSLFVLSSDSDEDNLLNNFHSLNIDENKILLEIDKIDKKLDAAIIKINSKLDQILEKLNK